VSPENSSGTDALPAYRSNLLRSCSTSFSLAAKSLRKHLEKELSEGSRGEGIVLVPLRPFLFAVLASAASLAEDSWRKHVLPPFVDSEGRLTTRLKLPNAKKVETRIFGGPDFPMTKVESDVWVGTSPPLQPAQYLYMFLVDGVLMPDPSNGQTADHEIAPVNRILVTGKSPMPWDPADVPRGTIHRHIFRSELAGDEREYWVYTPPGYTATRKYPVVVLLHGFSDTSEAWSKYGRANFIMDSLIASSDVRPAILVMPYGYGIPFSRVLDIRDDAEGEQNFLRFENSLIREVLPRVDSEYNVDRSARKRAIAGFSMGANQAIRIGISHREIFSAIGAFAGAVAEPEKNLPAIPEKEIQKMRLLWVGFGKEDGAEEERRFFTTMKQKGFPVVWREYEGGHGWQVTQRQLVEFLKALKN
jgi:enterochelin esterase family protein